VSARITYSILHRDDTLLAVDKAPGVLTVAAPGSRERCLLDDLRRDGHKVAPVHRLDRDTSGVLLLCLDPAHRAELEQAFRRHEVRKEYLALVHGVPAERRATIDVPIRDLGATARVERGGARAVTHYEVLATLPGRGAGGPASLVRLRLESGRHNQVRLHMAHIGHPLLGDDKYGRRPRGAPAFRPSRCLLHAELLALRHPATGRPLELHAAPPPDLQAALEALRG
jgi:23S rRNA pseudouridine1911/1915/1917 synthase